MNRFEEVRLQRGKTQQELADACGVTRQAIGGIERGAIPGGAVLIRLAVELGVDALYLLGESDTPQRANRLPRGWEQAVEEWVAIGLSPADIRQAVRAWRVARGSESENAQHPDA